MQTLAQHVQLLTPKRRQFSPLLDFIKIVQFKSEAKKSRMSKRHKQRQTQQIEQEKVNIGNGKLRIRNAIAKDAKVLSKWWNDGRVMAHAGFPNGIGISEREIVESLEIDNDLNRRLIIELENEPIGEMNYRTPKEKTAEIGIKICDSRQQNKGYGTISLKMLMKYIFLSMGYDQIILDTNLKNKRAQYVYERLGFRKARTKIDSWKDQLGEMQSSVDYEMSREEFLKFNAGLRR